MDEILRAEIEGSKEPVESGHDCVSKMCRLDGVTVLVDTTMTSNTKTHLDTMTTITALQTKVGSI